MGIIFFTLRFIVPLIFLAFGYYLGFHQYGFDVFQKILEMAESF
tara:strand:+ start:306 stop:437 length:132 start_codon:yes stop_codon:yes gene_type:complete